MRGHVTAQITGHGSAIVARKAWNDAAMLGRHFPNFVRTDGRSVIILSFWT